jgi:hypothetical protein
MRYHKTVINNTKPDNPKHSKYVHFIISTTFQHNKNSNSVKTTEKKKEKKRKLARGVPRMRE